MPSPSAISRITSGAYLTLLTTAIMLAIPASAVVGNPEETCVETSKPVGQYCMPLPSLAKEQRSSHMEL